MQNVAVHFDLAHRKGCRRPRQCWVRNWILERPLFGQYEVLMDQLNQEKTIFLESLPAGLKVAITLRYLSTGDAYKTLLYAFRVAFNTISLFVPEVCEAICVRQSTRCITLTYGHKMAQEVKVHVLQLQGFILNGDVSSCGR